jgi:hypothetical protein
MVPDVPYTVTGAPFPDVVKVELTSGERVELRDAVDGAAKIGAGIINDNNAVLPGAGLSVDTGSVATGKCRDCAKSFLAPLLSKPQRAKLELGEPFRCRDCAAKAKVKFELGAAAKAASQRPT